MEGGGYQYDGRPQPCVLIGYPTLIFGFLASNIRDYPEQAPQVESSLEP